MKRFADLVAKIMRDPKRAANVERHRQEAEAEIEAYDDTEMTYEEFERLWAKHARTTIAPPSQQCAACGKDPAEGWAFANGKRYCHPDSGRSCYEDRHDALLDRDWGDVWNTLPEPDE